MAQAVEDSPKVLNKQKLRKYALETCKRGVALYISSIDCESLGRAVMVRT
jgi:hypothetical protein